MSEKLYNVFIVDSINYDIDTNKLDDTVFSDVPSVVLELPDHSYINTFNDNEDNKGYSDGINDTDDNDSIISLDSVIMDNFKQGLLYFSQVLNKYSTIKDPVIAYTSRKYINSYLLTYIKHVIKQNEIQFLINNNPDMVLNFHNKLVISDLDTDILDCWIPKLYGGLKEMFRKQFYQVTHSIILTNLINCQKFRKYLYTHELDDGLSAKKLEDNTLIGILIKYMDSDDKIKTLEKVLYILIYQYDDD